MTPNVFIMLHTALNIWQSLLLQCQLHYTGPSNYFSTYFAKFLPH